MSTHIRLRQLERRAKRAGVEVDYDFEESIATAILPGVTYTATIPPTVDGAR